jgi:DNA polymerase-4/DNA polymerase V
MPTYKLRKEFPKVIVLPGDYQSYADYSGKMFDIVRRYADTVEEYSIDECFADLTGLEKPLKMSYEQIARKIKKEIEDELHISVSFGLAPTKVLAKVASKWVKPNGFTIIEKNTARDFLDKTPIGKVWGIGIKTSQFLKKKGIQTAGDLACKNREWIEENLGSNGEAIWYEMNSVPINQVDSSQKTLYGSMQKTRTFYPPTNNIDFLFSQLSKHIEQACAKARHYRLVAKGASIFIKTKDFRYVRRALPLPSPTNAPEILVGLARKELEKMHGQNNLEGVLYRTTGVSLFDLVPEEAWQSDLFADLSRKGKRVGKFEAIHRSIDELEHKFGKRVVYLASTHDAYERDEEEEGTDAKEEGRDLRFM